MSPFKRGLKKKNAWRKLYLLDPKWSSPFSSTQEHPPQWAPSCLHLDGNTFDQQLWEKKKLPDSGTLLAAEGECKVKPSSKDESASGGPFLLCTQAVGVFGFLLLVVFCFSFFVLQLVHRSEHPHPPEARILNARSVLGWQDALNPSNLLFIF